VGAQHPFATHEGRKSGGRCTTTDCPRYWRPCSVALERVQARLFQDKGWSMIKISIGRVVVIEIDITIVLIVALILATQLAHMQA
jgi:hypothetical protein